MTGKHWAAIAVVLALCACSRPSAELQHQRYIVTPLADGKALLLDQASGETWRFNGESWVPVPKLALTPTMGDPLGLRNPR